MQAEDHMVCGLFIHMKVEAHCGAEFSALIVAQRNLAKKWGPGRRRCCLRPLRGPSCRDDFAGTPRGP